MKSIRFSLLLLFILFLCVVPQDVYAVSTKKFTLVIDAGHGGHDAGAVGRLSKEKDINLSVALLFGNLVEQFCPDVKVIYTRKSDVFVELNERAAIANRKKANLFISIHTNAVPKGRVARGFSTYTLGMARAAENLDVAKRENSVITYEKDYREKYEGFDPNSAESYIMFEFMQDKNMAQSVELAQCIQDNVVRTAERSDMGIHQAGFLVLRKTSMPSCLIELGFISTPDEEDFLNTEIGQEALARGIFNAFVVYLNKHSKGVVASLFQTPEESTPKKTKHKKSKQEETAIVQKPAAVINVVATPMPKTQSIKEQQTTKPTSIVEQKPIENSAPTKNVEPTKEEVTQKEKKPENKTVVQLKVQIEKDSTVNSTDAKKDTSHTLAALFPGNAKYYAVQFFALTSPINITDKRFQTIDNIEYYYDGKSYKYITGKTTNITEAKALCKKIKEIFPDAFMIVVQNGKRQ